MPEIRWYEKRDGKITGSYAREQIGRDDLVPLPDDHPDVLEFLEFQKNPDIRMTIEDFTKKQIELLDVKVREFVYTRYPQHRQITLSKLLTDARLAGKSEAVAYLSQCDAWMQTAFAFYYQKEDAIVAIANGETTDAEKKQAILDVVEKIDFSTLEASDPKTTIRNSMALLLNP